ncbi:MAG: hypothetical protein ACJ71Z_12960 [Aeromicrobium sp.]
MTDAPTSASIDIAIDVAELAKKSSVSWIQAGPDTYPVWHEWVEDAICVVGSLEAGGSEQSIPALEDGDTVVVLLRSKTDRQLAAAVSVVASVIQPGSERWEPVTSALKAGRLNAPDLPQVVERWARECRVIRLVPASAATPASELPEVHPRTSPRLS